MFLYALVAAFIFPTHAFKPVACYSYKAGSIKVEWIAYKFTEKTGVKGTFKTVTTAVKTPPQSEVELLTNTSFEIDALSVSTDNPARDTTLSEHFFKLMKSTKITGFIKSVKDGTAIVDLKMNDVNKLIKFKYEKKDGKFIATGTVDVLDFAMEPSMKKINESCHELHKGADGVSKTWSTVDLTITAEPEFTCKGKK